ncbi:MAG: WYL domain-containing protein, partial [Nocardioides sp.]
VGAPAAYDIPPGVDIQEVARRLAPPAATEPVTLLVREGAGHPLRRSAATTETGVPGPDEETAWDRLVLTRGGVELADEVLSYGPGVYVESPQELRDVVVGRLTAVVGKEA